MLTRHRVLLRILLTIAPAMAGAQGVATAGLQGTIRAEDREEVGAHVLVIHEATGFSVEVLAPRGRFVVPGLEPGGPYTVAVRAIGYTPQRRAGLTLLLGELARADFALLPVASALDTVTVLDRSGASDGSVHSDGGIGTTISARMLERLPTLNRDLYDFVRLVPQASTKISLANPGLSAGGIGFRFNNFLISGVSDRTLSGGVSGAFAGRKSIPLDAVQEYQVLLSPFDVRYGDFAGALVNAVTKSGTNTFRGSAFAYGRNDRLARRTDSTERAPYDRSQYGFSLGGPILHNRMHFFIAPEIQRFTFPAPGPFVGQAGGSSTPVPVATEDLARFDAIMKRYGLSGGSAGKVEIGSPLRNLFARVDLAVPRWKSRVVAWNNYGRSDEAVFSRAARDTFSLSSYGLTRGARARTTALHIHTSLPRFQAHNELLVSQRLESLNAVGAVQQPIVRVSVPAVSGGRITLNSGTHETAQATSLGASVLAVKDNITFPVGVNNVVTVGAELESFQSRRGRSFGSYGTWSFASLDALEFGLAEQYEVRVDLQNRGPTLSGTQVAAYLGNRWTASDRLSITGGVRADRLAIGSRAPSHPLVDSIFGRRTDEMPHSRIELSPRLGFVWEGGGEWQQKLRGGAGLFTARYPLAWPHAALVSYGTGGTLRCQRTPSGIAAPPEFNPDYTAAPSACAGGASLTASNLGDVDLVDRNLRMMRVARTSLAYARRVPGNLLLSTEGMYSRALSDFVFENLNLAGPVTTDPFGRVMYGTIGRTGIATVNKRSGFSEVIDLRNTSRNHSYQLTTKVEKTQSDGLSGSMSYTFSRARDVQTPTRVNTRGTVAWGSARVTSGRHDDLRLGVSSNDIPHRLIIAGSYLAPWAGRRTLVSFYYVGESGRPFTYTAFGAGRRGDLNADGSNSNDPVPVPLTALDPNEIRFTGFSESAGADNSPATIGERERMQQAAFEDFIAQRDCLAKQRGRILARNSCREPWSNTSIGSVRQIIPVGNRLLEAQIDLFNVLNFLNRDWGHRREASPGLLEHVGQTSDQVGSQSVFRFIGSKSGWTTLPTESAFQLQLALRYRF